MSGIIELVIFITATIASKLYMNSVKSAVPKGEVNLEPLTKKEKTYILVLSILSPIVAGAVFYYGWIKKLPKKAKRANVYSFIVFFILLAIYTIIDLL
jgi:hypothetical protein